jgi:hypothetical protein
MPVIRHNTDTGNMALYADAQSAGDGMPVYTTEGELAAGKASIAELARFHNTLVPADKAVKTFKDKATAARRVWAVVQQSVEEPISEEHPDNVPLDEPVNTEAVNDAPARRGRKPGTGEFAGKTVFAKKQVNPRRAGTSGFASYEIIRGKAEGVPYADYIAAGGRPNDLRWDIEHKYAEVK